MLEKRSGVWYLYGIIIFVVLWYMAWALVKLPIIPSPMAVMGNLVDIFVSKIVIHGFYSLWRIVAGVFLSVIIGIPIGLCMG